MAKSPATKAPESTKPMATNTAVASYVNPGALSLDVGEKAVKAFKSVKDTDQTISDLMNENAAKKGQTLAYLTEAFVKAALNDKTILLANIHKDEKALQKTLRQKLDVAIGVKQVTRGEDGTEKFTMAPWTKDIFAQPGESKETPGWQAKENFRTNWATAVTKCVKAAHAIQAKQLSAHIDKVSGTLLVEGKAIKETFGVDKVSLNEKRDVDDGKGGKTKLAKIPSYTELARISSQMAGKTLKTRVDSRAKEVNALNEDDVLTAVKSIATTLDKLESFGDELATALEDLQEACQDALDRRKEAEEGKDEAA
jgi:hypothetical protein